MSTFAANLADRIMPERGVRQWVLTLPVRLRFRCALEKDFLGKVLGIWHREVLRMQRKRGRALHGADAESGLVSVVQRFGSDLRLNVHFHTLVLDGRFLR
jgi:hypothetical protein